MNFNQLIDSKWTLHFRYFVIPFLNAFSFETRVTHKITEKKKKNENTVI